MHWGNFGGMGAAGFGLGWVFMILFWVLVILGVVYLMKQLFGAGKPGVEKESADEILKRRFASGEISREEYRSARDLLSHKS